MSIKTGHLLDVSCACVAGKGLSELGGAGSWELVTSGSACRWGLAKSNAERTEDTEKSGEGSGRWARGGGAVKERRMIRRRGLGSVGAPGWPAQKEKLCARVADRAFRVFSVGCSGMEGKENRGPARYGGTVRAAGSWEAGARRARLGGARDGTEVTGDSAARLRRCAEGTTQCANRVLRESLPYPAIRLISLPSGHPRYFLVERKMYEFRTRAPFGSPQNQT